MSDTNGSQDLFFFKVPLDVIMDGGRGGGQPETLKLLPHAPIPIVAASAVALEPTSSRFRVAFAYAIPDLHAFVSDHVFNFVTDTIEVVVATTVWGHSAINDQNIVAKLQVPYASAAVGATPLAASGAGTAVYARDPSQSSGDLRWSILIRALGSRRNGGALTSSRFDVSGIAFTVAGIAPRHHHVTTDVPMPDIPTTLSQG